MTIVTTKSDRTSNYDKEVITFFSQGEVVVDSLSAVLSPYKSVPLRNYLRCPHVTTLSVVSNLTYQRQKLSTVAKISDI